MTHATDSTPPLHGLLVVDLTRVLSGPYCTMQLADMGARVIKIEQPGRGDDTRGWGPPFVGEESAYFLSINRNKESLTLDLKQPGARRILEQLLDRADVLVENFRPGTMDRLGFGYESVAARWPRIVYCSISGFGQTGPRRDQPGYDAVIQAEAGLMSITGEAGGPALRLGVAIADIVSGMFAAQGIAMALLARARSGRGQLVDVGMLDATAALLTYQAANYFVTGRAPERLGNRHPTIVPYETFDAADGEFVLAVGNDDLWRRFCKVAGLPDLAADTRFATNRARVEHYDALKPILVDAAADANAGGVDRRAQRRRRSERRRPRHRGGIRRPSTRRPRDDPGRRARHARQRASARCPNQAVRHTRSRPHRPANPRSAHRSDSAYRSRADRRRYRAPARHRRSVTETSPYGSDCRPAGTLNRDCPP